MGAIPQKRDDQSQSQKAQGPTTHQRQLKPARSAAVLLNVPMGFQGPWLHTCLLWASVATLLFRPVVTQELRGSGLGHGNWNNNAGIPGSSEDLSTEFGHHSHRGYQGEKDRDHREEDEDFSREYGHQTQDHRYPGHEVGEENVSEEVFRGRVRQLHGHQERNSEDSGDSAENHFPRQTSYSHEDEDGIVSREYHHHVPRYVHHGHGEEDDDGGQEKRVDVMKDSDDKHQARGHQSHSEERDGLHHAHSHRHQDHSDDDDDDDEDGVSIEYGHKAHRHQDRDKKDDGDSDEDSYTHRLQGQEDENDNEDGDSGEYGHQTQDHQGHKEE